MPHSCRLRRRRHDISVAVAYRSTLGLKHTRAMGIRRLKYTMTNNLKYHRRSKHTDRNIHADVYSKLFLGFDASQHTRQLISTLKDITQTQ